MTVILKIKEFKEGTGPNQRKNMNAVRDLFRVLRNPEVDYEFSGEDRFRIVPDTPRAVLAKLVSIDEGDPRMSIIRRDVETEVATSNHDQQQMREADKVHDLAAFLRWIRLVPAREGRERRTHDLLVASYGSHPDFWRRLYAEIPKSYDQNCTVRFLHNAGPHLPRFIVSLPNAEPEQDWGLWLHAICRRFSQEKIRLFYKLPGGVSAEYYIEFGYRHPMPSIREFYPNEEDARMFLITGDAVAESGQGQSDREEGFWTAVNYPAGGRLVGIERDTEQFDVQLGGDPQVDLVHAVPEAPQLSWVAELLPIAEEHAGRLRNLEGRILAAKETVYRLDSERRLLLDRGRDRYRFILLFAQPAAPEGEAPTIASSFQRFLNLSRRQLDRFEYGYIKVEDELFHVVRTREALRDSDLHLGLATRVFSQPQFWGDSNLLLYVDRNHELFPRIDQAETAKSLARTLLDVPGVRRGECLLLGRPNEYDGPLRILPLAFPPDECNLAKRLSFLNKQFLRVSIEAVHDVDENLRRTLEQTQADLQEETEKVERELMGEAERRLEVARSTWLQLQPRVEGILHAGRTIAGNLQLVEECLTDAGHSWQKFLDGLLDIQLALVKPKLDALEKLGQWHPSYLNRADSVQAANKDVKKLLDGLKKRLDSAELDAKTALCQALDAYGQTAKLYHTIVPKTREIREDNEFLESEAEATKGEAQSKVANLETQVKRAADVVEELEDLVAELQKVRVDLSLLVSKVTNGLHLAQSVAGDIERQDQTVQARSEEWRRVVENAQRRGDEVKATCLATEKEIREREDQISQLESEAREKRDELKERKQKLDENIVRADVEISNLDSERQEIEGQIAKLDGLRSKLASVKDDTVQAREGLDKVAPQIVSLLDHIETTGQKEWKSLLQRARDLRTDLGTLAQTQLEMGALGELEAGVEAQAQFLNALDSDTRKRIWGRDLIESN